MFRYAISEPVDSDRENGDEITGAHRCTHRRIDARWADPIVGVPEIA
jgi:hypothetical protein